MAIHTAAALASIASVAPRSKPSAKAARGKADDQRLPHDETVASIRAASSRARRAMPSWVLATHEGRASVRQPIKKRCDRVGVDPQRQPVHDNRQQHRDQCGKRQTSSSGCRKEIRAANSCSPQVRYSGMIFLRRRRDAEIHHAAEQQHPGPDIDIGRRNPSRPSSARAGFAER